VKKIQSFDLYALHVKITYVLKGCCNLSLFKLAILTTQYQNGQRRVKICNTKIALPTPPPNKEPGTAPKGLLIGRLILN
jgi:hypothetical protein